MLTTVAMATFEEKIRSISPDTSSVHAQPLGFGQLCFYHELIHPLGHNEAENTCWKDSKNNPVHLSAVGD